MKLIEIDIDSKQTINQLTEEFKLNNLMLGDEVLLKSEGIKEKHFIIIAVLIAVSTALAIYFDNKKKYLQYADKVIKDAFNTETIEDVKLKIKNEFGINISVEDKEQISWNDYGLKQLSKAYSDEEPDYNNILIKEPNSSYNKNARG